MEVFTKQIEEVTNRTKKVLILGDANLCSTKWNEKDFTNIRVANELRNTLEGCGLELIEIGHTFLSDGNSTESSLDHIYVAKEFVQRNLC